MAPLNTPLYASGFGEWYTIGTTIMNHTELNL